MKMHKEIIKEENVINLTAVTYRKVTFSNGFMDFINSLETAKLIENVKRVPLEHGFQWADLRKDGGILLKTSTQPNLNSNKTSTMRIVGKRDAILEIEKIINNNNILYESKTTKFNTQLLPQYQKTLNPKFWNDHEMKEKILKRLRKISNEFIEFIELPDLVVKDIVVTGSNANFNWSKFSDIDLHILVDMEAEKEKYGKLLEEFLALKRGNWNLNHKIALHDVPVELYVERTKETHVSSGIFSISNNKWVIEPTYKKPKFDNNAVIRKADMLLRDITQAIKSKKIENVNTVIERIWDYRKCGLQKSGEFSTENLVFKYLRNNGSLDAIRKSKLSLLDASLSIEEEEQMHLFKL